MSDMFEGAGVILFGIAAVIGIVIVIVAGVRMSENISENNTRAKIEKTRACSTIQEEPLRVFCVTNGGR